MADWPSVRMGRDGALACLMDRVTVALIVATGGFFFFGTKSIMNPLIMSPFTQTFTAHFLGCCWTPREAQDETSALK